MGLVRTVKPSVSPVLVQDVKQNLGIAEAVTEHDELLLRLVSTASDMAERLTGRAWTTQTWVLTLDRFPYSDEAIVLPRPPLQSITSIQYVDSDGATQTWDSSNYRVDDQGSPGRVTLAYGESWPTTRDVTNAVTITYVAGYGDTANDTPIEMQNAIHLTVKDWFDNPSGEMSPNAKNILKGLHCGMVLGTYEVQ